MRRRYSEENPSFADRVRAGEASFPSQAGKQFSEPAVIRFAWPDNQVYERRLLAEGGLHLPLVTIHAPQGYNN